MLEKMADKLSSIDMKELEEQLESAIEEDKKYWLRNEAKLKAVSDHVETYNEFKNLVDAAHLKPLDKSDNLSKEKLNKTIWNKFAEKDSCKNDCSVSSDHVNHNSNKSSEGNSNLKPEKDTEAPPDITCADKNNFLDILNRSEDKLTSLITLGAPQFVEIFQNEISSSTLVEVLKVLSSFDRNSVEHIVFVSEFLGELINIERFSITLSFLSSEEKQTVESLFEKLNSCFILKSSELKELCFDEDHLSALKIVYQL